MAVWPIRLELQTRRHSLFNGEVVRTVKAGTRGAIRAGCLTTQGSARLVQAECLTA